jgi:RimJ/RimL family protein N-acetyltransferase
MGKIGAFEPTYENVLALAQYMMDGKFCLSDELRNPYYAASVIDNRFPGGEIRDNDEIYGIYNASGKVCGLVGFIDIMDGWKCRLMFKLWDKSGFGSDMVRGSRDIIVDVMRRHGLRRVYSATSDPQVLRMAAMVGFEREGTLKDDIRWDGNYYDTWLIALAGEV